MFGLLYWLMVKLFSTGATNLFQETSNLFQYIIVPEVNVLFQVFFPHWKQFFSFLCLSQILPPLSEHGLLKGPFLQPPIGLKVAS